MRKIICLIICIHLVVLSSCDVHEWPETPGSVKLHLRLDYETEMTEWEHFYDEESVIGKGLGDKYDNHLVSGKIRYVIRTYPTSARQRMTQDFVQEFVFMREIAEGYDHELTLDVLPGEYNIMVWSDLMEREGDRHFHNADNFAEICLQGVHAGNTDHRDAFRGSSRITLATDVMERLPDTLDIVMQRPLAKFEFVTNDVEDFIDKEATRLASKSNSDKTLSSDGTITKTVNLEDYKVVFYYVGFMPDTYSLHTDKPVDSSTDIFFESTLRKLSDSQASMGFDYVFVNGKESTVTLRIGLYDNEGTQLSMTEPIAVPLKRNHHTIISGLFLMSEATGGVFINPEFDGDHNLIFP